MEIKGEPKLEAPGAGLPAMELLAARILFRLGRSFTSRARVTRQFSSRRDALVELVGTIDSETSARQILIRRMVGLEDSSRNWSILMTLEHLRIVNDGIAATINSLLDGEIPEGKVSTADVKPEADVTNTVIEAFQQSCDSYLRVIASHPTLKSSIRYDHPWFGPLDAFGWHTLAALHMKIHINQIWQIIAQTKAN